MQRTKLIRMGKCNRCGDCCREELLESRIEAYEKAGVPYKRVNQNCDKFNPETGLCTDYENRPQNCRDFPTHPVDLIALPRCSYYFIAVPRSGPSQRKLSAYQLYKEKDLSYFELAKEIGVKTKTARRYVQEVRRYLGENNLD